MKQMVEYAIILIRDTMNLPLRYGRYPCSRKERHEEPDPLGISLRP